MTKKRETYWVLIGVVFVPIVAFVSGMAINAFTIAEKIATKPYVDDRFLESKKYTDDKASQVLRDAIDHSDRNRSDMMVKVEALGAELKTNSAIIGTKVDSLMRSMQDMRDWQVERRSKR